MDKEIFMLAQKLGEVLSSKGWMIAVAESCTGGGLCQVITDAPGSSAWFDRGFITYSNQAKMELLGVDAETLERFGAVSAETALEMAEGVLSRSNADVAIAITGIAGPGGGTAEKPVGTVFIAYAFEQQLSRADKQLFKGNRREVRQATIKTALLTLFEEIDSKRSGGASA